MKVFPDKEVRDFVVQTQAQSLCGRKTEDKVYTHTGRGDNGKSILIEIIKNAFGDYFLNIPVTLLTTQNANGHNTPDPFKAKFKGVRYAMSNEPKDGAKFNDSLIKTIGSQEQIEYRLLYSNDPVFMNPQMKLNIYCNNKLTFNGEDQGMGRRMCVIDYISKFDKKPDEANNIFLIDVGLTNKVKTWKQDYMKLLISLYKAESIVESSNVYVNDNNAVYKFVKDNYIKTGNPKDYIILKNIKINY
jgi:putative DNA primase/helicase